VEELRVLPLQTRQRQTVQTPSLAQLHLRVVVEVAMEHPPIQQILAVQEVVEPMLVDQQQVALETLHQPRHLKEATVEMEFLLTLILLVEVVAGLLLLAVTLLLVRPLMRLVGLEQRHQLVDHP
jgi:hypothetical protein